MMRIGSFMVSDYRDAGATPACDQLLAQWRAWHGITIFCAGRRS
jgi:hypothetical protein